MENNNSYQPIEQKHIIEVKNLLIKGFFNQCVIQNVLSQNECEPSKLKIEEYNTNSNNKFLNEIQCLLQFWSLIDNSITNKFTIQLSANNDVKNTNIIYQNYLYLPKKYFNQQQEKYYFFIIRKTKSSKSIQNEVADQEKNELPSSILEVTNYNPQQQVPINIQQQQQQLKEQQQKQSQQQKKEVSQKSNNDNIQDNNNKYDKNIQNNLVITIIFKEIQSSFPNIFNTSIFGNSILDLFKIEQLQSSDISQFIKKNLLDFKQSELPEENIQNLFLKYLRLLINTSNENTEELSNLFQLQFQEGRKCNNCQQYNNYFIEEGISYSIKKKETILKTDNLNNILSLSLKQIQLQDEKLLFCYQCQSFAYHSAVKEYTGLPFFLFVRYSNQSNKDLKEIANQTYQVNDKFYCVNGVVGLNNITYQFQFINKLEINDYGDQIIPTLFMMKQSSGQ